MKTIIICQTDSGILRGVLISENEDGVRFMARYAETDSGKALAHDGYPTRARREDCEFVEEEPFDVELALEFLCRTIPKEV